MQRLLSPRPKTSIPKDQGFVTSAYGQNVPRVWGYTRVTPIRIWQLPTKLGIKRGGKGGGMKQGKGDRLYASWADLLSDRPLSEKSPILKILSNGEVIYDLEKESQGDQKWRDTNRKLEKFFTVHTGINNIVDSTIVAREGITKTPAYKGFAYVVWNGYNCEAAGNRIPNMEYIAYAPVGSQATTSEYASSGYNIAPYDIEVTVKDNTIAANIKTIRVTNVPGPIIRVRINLSTTDVYNDTGTVVFDTVSGVFTTTITGKEYGKEWAGGSRNLDKISGVTASVKIDNFYTVGSNTPITTLYPSTNIPNFQPEPESIKLINIRPQKIRDLLDDLITTVNKGNPFLTAKLDTSEVPDDLVFNGYKTSGNFDALSVVLEVTKLYSLYFTYESGIPALVKNTNPEYFELHDSDFVSDSSASLYSVEYTDARQTPKELIFKYSNIEQDMQDDVVVSRISSTDFYGGIVEESTAFSLTHANAKGLAQNQLSVIVNRGIDFSFQLHPRRKHIKIGTLLYYKDFNNIVKCEEIKYGFDHTVQVKAVVYNPILDYQLLVPVFNYTGSSFTSGSSSAVSQPSIAGQVSIANLPIFNSSDLNNSIYVVLIANNSYRGGEVRTSFDAGASYDSAFSMANPSLYGRLAFPLGGYCSHLIEDKGNEPVVKMENGELYSLTEKDYNNYQTLLLINGEIICYRYATLQADGYRLAKLQRGLFGTEKNIKLHPTGSKVYVLDSLKRIPDDLANIDRPRIAILVDNDQIQSDATPVYATNTGESIKPYNPHIWSVKRDRTNNNIVIKWAPRDRLQPSLLNNFIAQTDPDNFRLKIGTSRIIDTTDRECTYTNTQQIADAFTGDSLVIDLIHIGTQAVNSDSNSKEYQVV